MVGFRPGEDLGLPALAVAEPVALGFTRAADAGGTDFDVLMGYQVFLGRDPESSFVIADAKTSPVGAFIRALMGSGEFQSAVLDRLASGRRLPHESSAAGPSAEQLAWVFTHLTLPSSAEAALRTIPDWRGWLHLLVGVPGFPHAPDRAPAPAELGLTPVAASEGFVLIHIEQPKPGEAVHPGGLVSGSGWAIAPADVAEVAIQLDGVLLTHARYGLPRPDVARSFPHYRHVDHCGFTFSAEVPAGHRLGAAPELSVVVRSAGGDRARKAVRLQAPAAAAGTGAEPGVASAVAAGAAEPWPIRLAIEEVEIDPAGVLRLRGWAASRREMAAISVFLGDVPLGEATHGIRRPDIASVHPGLPNAGTAGFVLTTPLPEDIEAGPGFVRVQASDVAGQSRQTIAPVNIPARGSASDGAAVTENALAPAEIPSAPDMRLEIDRPILEGETVAEIVHGALTISGWAVARGGLQGVSVFCDDKLLGAAHLGMRREDIGAAFAEYEGSLLAGYALVLPPGVLPAGTHRIRVEARGKGGGQTIERRFTLTVDAYDALPPEGGIRRRMPPAEAAFGLRLLEKRGFRPHFEIVMALPAGGANLAALRETLATLAAQAYPDWTFTALLPNAASLAAARKVVADDPGRVRFAVAGGKTPARASKPGASPQFVLRLRPGDLLGCDALLELGCELAIGGADFAYSDDLRLDAAHRRRQPFFKPGWSPELLLGLNYVGRGFCAAAAVLKKAGLTASALADLADYDVVLRLTEHAAKIGHVSRVLLEHGEAADTPAEESAALAAALARRGVTGRIEPGAAAGTWRVRRDILAPGRAKKSSGKRVPGLVSVIMPTCGARGLVRTAIATIRANSAPALRGGRPVEIVILDNSPARDKRLKTWLRAQADVVIDMKGTFNWSRFNNEGARAASGEYLLFLNDDIEITGPDWLDAMLEHAQRPEVGVVGARLLYPDGTVQHGGQYLADTHARHAFRFAEGASAGPFGIAAVAREMASVTGACQMMHRRVFEQLGGYDEAHSVVNNDLDVCLRAGQAGLSVIYTPHASLIHHELASRAGLEDCFDESRFTGAWRTRLLKGDPFRSPRLGAEADHEGPDREPVGALHVGRRGPEAGEVRRILAVKLDHIGDFLTALPALDSLKRRFPAASIDLLAPTASAELARGHGAIAETIVFDFFHARSGEGRRGVGEAEFEALRARLAPRGYDIAIDLRMQPETREVLRHTGAGFLVGYDHGDRFPWLDAALEWEGDHRLIAKRAHISERLVQLVSVAADACRADPIAPAAAALAADAVPALAGLPAAFLAKRLVCVHPGVGNPVRQWPAAHYAGLIELLAEAGLHVVLIGAPEEAPIAEAIVRQVQSAGAVESLVGRVKLGQLSDVMRACVLFVGNNSGPQHLAASLGLPSIGIHSGVVDATEWAPLGAQAMALRRRMICGPCYLEFASDCPRSLACLTGLRPRDVFAACRRLLALQ